MVHLTETERIIILTMVGFADRMRTQHKVCVLFNETYPNRQPISQSVVSKTLKRFKKTGHVKDIPQCGPPNVATNEDMRQGVLEEITDNPHTSIRQLALNFDVSTGSIQNILKKEKQHPYKPALLQELSEDDFDRRVQLCEEMMRRINDDPNFINKIIFSDEPIFYLNGKVNRHNCRYWSAENPHWAIETHI
ncbi:uncharacterized protein [Onthophagus taurus]|uniref:uncharacterized protein n=1 Tax=Onthophagus taurus TaxID=166361 RepID=UPI0039BE1419